jgi:hypothetical protein
VRELSNNLVLLPPPRGEGCSTQRLRPVPKPPSTSTGRLCRAEHLQVQVRKRQRVLSDSHKIATFCSSSELWLGPPVPARHTELERGRAGIDSALSDGRDRSMQRPAPLNHTSALLGFMVLT